MLPTARGVGKSYCTHSVVPVCFHHVNRGTFASADPWAGTMPSHRASVVSADPVWLAVAW